MHVSVKDHTIFVSNNPEYVGYEILTLVVMSAAISWNIAPCRPYVNRRFE
jgi:hypothetical protein